MQIKVHFFEKKAVYGYEPTFLCESVIHVKVKPTRMTEWVSSYSFLHVVSDAFSMRWLFRHRLRTMLMDEPLTD